MRAAVVSMKEEQKDDVFIFLECNTEELNDFFNDLGLQAVANMLFLKYWIPLIFKPIYHLVMLVCIYIKHTFFTFNKSIILLSYLDIKVHTIHRNIYTLIVEKSSINMVTVPMACCPFPSLRHASLSKYS